MSMTIQACALCGNFLDDDGECGECSHSDNSTLSFQVGGNHYKDSAIQPIEYITANNLNFLEGNIVKYVSRYKKKNGLEDLMKLKQYVEFLIDDYTKEAKR
jgi:hypothetical protein